MFYIPSLCNDPSHRTSNLMYLPMHIVGKSFQKDYQTQILEPLSFTLLYHSQTLYTLSPNGKPISPNFHTSVGYKLIKIRQNNENAIRLQWVAEVNGTSSCESSSIIFVVSSFFKIGSSLSTLLFPSDVPVPIPAGTLSRQLLPRRLYEFVKL